MVLTRRYYIHIISTRAKLHAVVLSIGMLQVGLLLCFGVCTCGTWYLVYICIYLPLPRMIRDSLFCSRLSVCLSVFIPLLSCMLNLLEPQSRFGDKLLIIWVVCPQNGTAVLKGLSSQPLLLGIIYVPVFVIRPAFSRYIFSPLPLRFSSRRRRACRTCIHLSECSAQRSLTSLDCEYAQKKF